MPLETTLKAKVIDLTQGYPGDSNFISQSLTDGYKDLVSKISLFLPFGI